MKVKMSDFHFKKKQQKTGRCLKVADKVASLTDGLLRGSGNPTFFFLRCQGIRTPCLVRSSRKIYPSNQRTLKIRRRERVKRKSKESNGTGTEPWSSVSLTLNKE